MSVLTPARAGEISAAHAIAFTRSLGTLRTVTEEQAPLVAVAVLADRRLRPRWQRYGDGFHESHATKEAIRAGRRWVRGTPVLRTGTRGQGWHAPRRAADTGYAFLNWHSAEHWTTHVVTAALRLRPDALHTHRGGVAAERFLEYCALLAQHTGANGTRCIVRPKELAKLLGVHKSTVQRCQAAAEDLGLYVVLEPGRMLEEEERRSAYNRGSLQRGLANEAVLVTPHWLAHEAPDVIPAAPTTRSRNRLQQRHDTPTRGRYRKPHSLQVDGSLGNGEQRSAGKAEPTPSARHRRKSDENPQKPSRPAQRATRPPTRVYDPDALQLARALTERLSWLNGVAPGRLEPALRRFTRCRVSWTAGDVSSAIDARNRRLGRASMTKDIVRSPAALLAMYLRDLDPDADHPLGPDYMPDPAKPRVAAPSRTQDANRQRAAAARMRAEASGPAFRAHAIAEIRRQLETS